ncbi:MAG TPA: hypothetical protein O0W81_04795 [Methanocorpusculum sp.]|nr:hypothetical protein [Methanocorpusculum sp.]
MQCSRCDKDAAIIQPYSGLALCAVHAARDIEAKVKRRIRKCGGISFGEKLYVSGSRGPEQFALYVVLSRILLGRCDVSFVNNPDEATAVVSISTLDTSSCAFLQQIISGTVVEVFAPSGKKILDPLAIVPRNEIVFYARFHGWDGVDECSFVLDQFSKDVWTFLKHFMRGHPSVAYSLMQVRDGLSHIYQEKLNHAL